MTPSCLCGAELNPHNVTGVCAECKLDARNARMAGLIGPTRTDAQDYLLRGDPEPVLLADAIAMVLGTLGGRWLDGPDR